MTSPGHPGSTSGPPIPPAAPNAAGGYPVPAGVTGRTPWSASNASSGATANSSGPGAIPRRVFSRASRSDSASPAPVPRSSSHAQPLSLRLVIITVSLLTLGLLATGVATASALHNYLVEQIDSDLRTNSSTLAKTALEDFIGSSEVNQVLPSSYYLRYQQIDFLSPIERQDRYTQARTGKPQVRAFTDEEIISLSAMTSPVTLPGTIESVDWRAVNLPVIDKRTRETVGVFTLALPMTRVSNTMSSIIRWIVFGSAAIISVGALMAWWAVRRSLRPLREIEKTAQAIASGDLSRRVPPAPETTEVGSLALSLNVMLMHIESAFAARERSEKHMRRFISDASHELRTPLATVRGYAELYRLGGVPEGEVDAAMGRIESEARRMGTLVEDLLQLARLDEDRPLQITRVDLASLASDALKDLHARDASRPTRVLPYGPLVDPLNPVVPIYADADKITQVLANLLGNVLIHTPEGTAVEIAVGYAASAPTTSAAATSVLSPASVSPSDRRIGSSASSPEHAASPASTGSHEGDGHTPTTHCPHAPEAGGEDSQAPEPSGNTPTDYGPDCAHPGRKNAVSARTQTVRNANALEAAPSTGDWAVIEVRDHGPGISEESRQRVFDRFFRLDKSRSRESGGSGLGLSIVAAVVAKHNGTVRIRETAGGGTTVRITLPTAGPAPGDPGLVRGRLPG